MSTRAGSVAVTEGIRVEAEAFYVEEQSDPDARQYRFAYTIAITNEGTEPAQLRSRHWIIVDADNNREDVKGPGVVGKQPLLKPGERFEYTSGCPLTTSWGTMEGSYAMTRPDGRAFEAHIGRFFLVSKELASKSAR
jgi:ApaG protein